MSLKDDIKNWSIIIGILLAATSPVFGVWYLEIREKRYYQPFNNESFAAMLDKIHSEYYRLNPPRHQGNKQTEPNFPE